MSLSTSSSELPVQLQTPRRPSERSCTLITVCVFALAVAIAWSSRPQWHHHSIVAESVIPSAPEYHLAYSRGGIENYDIFLDLHGEAAALKQADVLFLGNSRMQHAFKDQDVLRTFFGKRSMRYYNLAFAYGEGEVFPEAIIRKFDLHPKWIVVNADPFFGLPATPFASRVMCGNRFDAFKFKLETLTSFEVRRHLHRFVPSLGLSDFDDQPDWIYYRSAEDGTISLSAYKGLASSVLADDQRFVGVNDPAALSAAEKFVAAMRARGCQVVFTWVPTGATVTNRRLLRLPGVPLIAPALSDLKTIDGSHLDDPSARRFAETFLESFAKLLDQRHESEGASGKSAAPAHD